MDTETSTASWNSTISHTEVTTSMLYTTHNNHKSTPERKKVTPTTITLPLLLPVATLTWLLLSIAALIIWGIWAIGLPTCLTCKFAPLDNLQLLLEILFYYVTQTNCHTPLESSSKCNSTRPKLYETTCLKWQLFSYCHIAVFCKPENLWMFHRKDFLSSFLRPCANSKMII